MAVWFHMGRRRRKLPLYINNNNLKYGDEKSSGEEYQTIIIMQLYKIKFM
tara:strand:- start:833 stop:982 length:150 start_codon:yes stop_codon:yes gene_type:complete